MSHSTPCQHLLSRLQIVHACIEHAKYVCMGCIHASSLVDMKCCVMSLQMWNMIRCTVGCPQLVQHDVWQSYISLYIVDLGIWGWFCMELVGSNALSSFCASCDCLWGYVIRMNNKTCAVQIHTPDPYALPLIVICTECPLSVTLSALCQWHL